MSTANVPVRSAAPRLDSLTGLRIIAALFVLLLHTTTSEETRIVDLPWLHAAVGLGALGVPFFFALSGFVLAWSAPPNDRPRHFYRRRFARVFPMHAATWLVACLAILLAGTGLSAAGAGLSLVLLQSWVPQDGIYFAANGVSWSLSCEAFFYALTPWLMPWLQRRGRPINTAVLATSGMAGASFLQVVYGGPFDKSFDLFVFPPFALGFFVVGLCCAELVRSGTRSPLALGPTILVAATTLAVCTWLASLLGLPITAASVVFLPVVALVLIAAADHDLHSPRRSFFAAPPMVRLGEWSFALYLVHTLLLRAMVKVGGWTPPSSTWANVATEVVFVAAAVLTSAAAYTLWEKPLERRLRRARSSGPLTEKAATTLPNDGRR